MLDFFLGGLVLSLALFALLFLFGELPAWVNRLFADAEQPQIDVTPRGPVFDVEPSRPLGERGSDAVREFLERAAGAMRGPGVLVLRAEYDGEVYSLEAIRAGRGWRLETREGAAYARKRREPGDPLHLSVSVRVPHASHVDLRVRRASDLKPDELAFAEDLRVGNKKFDARYVIEANGKPVLAPLAAKNVRKGVNRLMALPGIEELTLKDSRLAVRGVVGSKIGRKKLRVLATSLDALAAAFDRRPALTVELKGTFINTPEGAGGRCPYCHDDLGPSEEHVACDGCHTILHAECHAENGGCPILGCGDRSATLARWRVEG